MDIFVGKYAVYNSGVLVLSSDNTITMKIEDTDFIFDFEDVHTLVSYFTEHSVQLVHLQFVIRVRISTNALLQMQISISLH